MTLFPCDHEITSFEDGMCRRATCVYAVSLQYYLGHYTGLQKSIHSWPFNQSSSCQQLILLIYTNNFVEFIVFQDCPVCLCSLPFGYDAYKSIPIGMTRNKTFLAIMKHEFAKINLNKSTFLVNFNQGL